MPRVPMHPYDSRLYILRLHIVQQNAFSAIGQGFFQLGQIANFDFNRLLLTAIVQRLLQCSRYASSERNMIVLEQDTVREIQAVVLPAAATDGIFVQYAQARGSLARVQNA